MKLFSDLNSLLGKEESCRDEISLIQHLVQILEHRCRSTLKQHLSTTFSLNNSSVYETCQTTNPYPDTNPYTLDTDPYPVYTDSYPVKFFFCIFLTYFFVENSALNSSLGNWKKFLNKVFLP